MPDDDDYPYGRDPIVIRAAAPAKVAAPTLKELIEAAKRKEADKRRMPPTKPVKCIQCDKVTAWSRTVFVAYCSEECADAHETRAALEEPDRAQPRQWDELEYREGGFIYDSTIRKRY